VTKRGAVGLLTLGTIVATNTGTLSRELLELQTPTDGVGTLPVGADGKIDRSTSLGEASTSCGQGPGGGFSPGDGELGDASSGA
jgi:hypothetical protein